MNPTLLMHVASEDIRREFLTAFRGIAGIGEVEEVWETRQPLGTVFSTHPRDGSSCLSNVQFTCQIFNGTSYSSTSFVTLSWSSGRTLIEVRGKRNDNRFDVTSMDRTEAYGLNGLHMAIDRVIFNAKDFIARLEKSLRLPV